MLETSSFTTSLALALALAARRAGSVRIEPLDGGWEASITTGRRRVAIARDEYLEVALARLVTHAQVAQR